jgi:hypothetical protein
MSDNPQIHVCPDCFYGWSHGQDGSHSCVQRLKARISLLAAALRENHEWHQQHDEHGGYPDSALEVANTNALIGAAAEWRLPCAVRLPGGMTIGKGCSLNTLLLALRRREGGQPWQVSFDEPIPADPSLHEVLANLLPLPQARHWNGMGKLPPAGSCCEALLPHHTATGRQMIWSEVQVIAHDEHQGETHSWVREAGTSGGYYAPMPLQFRVIEKQQPLGVDSEGGSHD